MAATIKFTTQAVGDGLQNHHQDVKAVQQLLIAAGIPIHGGDDGRWGHATKDALFEYQNRKGLPNNARVDVGDEILLKMAIDARIVIPMPSGPGLLGLQQTHQWFVDNAIKYQPGADSGGGNRAIYGVDGNRKCALQTVNKKFSHGPVQMDCTTYVNLMLSLYLNGNVHGAPYDASCMAYGATGNNHCARERYGFPLVNRLEGQPPTQKKLNYFKTAAQIAAATRDHGGKLFVLEVGGGPGGGVSHMALYSGGQVYECTTHQPGAACIKRSLDQFMSNKTANIIYLFGPR